uniref:RNA pseudouridine synthase D3 n=2 Tax=Sus scrofa TaxID=9823 RepID=A0A8D0WW37_PIG
MLEIRMGGTSGRHQLQSRGSSKRLGSLGDKPFRRLLQPENLSREELVDVLREAVVDQKGPLVTLNKPQGLPVTGKPGELTLVSVLPELSQCLGLGERELQVVRASGKETSGLVLLSSCPQTASRLQKFFTHSQRARKPTATYCAVTDGIPAASEGKIQAALKMEHTDGASLVSQGLGGEEEGTLQRYYPHRGVKGIDLGWAVQVNDDFTVALSRVCWEQGGNRGR